MILIKDIKDEQGDQIYKKVEDCPKCKSSYHLAIKEGGGIMCIKCSAGACIEIWNVMVEK